MVVESLWVLMPVLFFFYMLRWGFNEQEKIREEVRAIWRGELPGHESPE